MCGCSSNFDGFNDLEELEVSPYLDFDGEDISIDEDFDDFFKKGALKGAIAKRKEKRGDTLLDKAKATTDYDSCLGKKPLIASKSNWQNACSTAHPNSVSAGSNPAVKDTPKGVEEAVKPSVLGDLTNVLKDKALGNAGASESVEPIVEPKKAGILEKKGLLIAGGVILLGLGIFAIRKFRR